MRKRDWMKIGQRYTRTAKQREAIIAAAARMEWVTVTDDLTLPVCPGGVIKAAVEQLKIPRVGLVSWKTFYHGMSLLGIEGHYKNGRVRLYCLDEGAAGTPLFADFMPCAERGGAKCGADDGCKLPPVDSPLGVEETPIAEPQPVLRAGPFDYDSQWDAYIKASNAGALCEIDEQIYSHFLEVLPPAYMGRTVEVAGKSRRVDFGFAEGADFITAFWREGGKHYSCRTDQLNPYA